MTIQYLKDALTKVADDVYFVVNGKDCSIEVDVHDSIFTYKMDCDGKITKTSDIDEVLTAKFFDGFSLIQLVDKKNTKFDFG